MQCPQCQSDDVYLCSVAHAQGTSKTTTTTRTQGQGFAPSGGGASYGAATHTSSSTSMTAFAAQAAPPSSSIPRALAAVVLFFLLTWGLPKMFSPSHPEPGGLKFLMTLALLGSIAWVALGVRNLPKLRRERETWRRTWICARCGHTFVPTGDGGR